MTDDRLLLIADLSGYTAYLVGGEAEEAPAPRSPCSSRMTRKPRPAASRAMLTPFNPPPMIARS